MFTRKINDNLSLALVQPSFAKHYLAIVEAQRDYLGQWLAWPHEELSEAFFIQFAKRTLQRYADGVSMGCAMIYQGDIAGNIGFNVIDHQLKKVKIGYWLREDLQGKGIVTQSVRALIDIAFNELDMTKVQIACAVDNHPSRSVCERLGFTLEGVITQAENINGRLVDHAVYGLKR